MTNIQIIKVEHYGQVTEHVIIDNGDGSFVSMTKPHYDELEAAKENGTIS